MKKRVNGTRNYVAKIMGITPLLFNRPTMADNLENENIIRTTEAQLVPVEEKLYKFQGKICTPSTHFKAGMREAGKKFPIKGGGGKATYSKVFMSSVRVSPIFIPHKYQEWVTHTTTACLGVGKNKRRITVQRPMMEKWELQFNMEVFDPTIPEHILRGALEYLGASIGIGDWRPATSGEFGTFEVAGFKEVK